MKFISKLIPALSLLTAATSVNALTVEVDYINVHPISNECSTRLYSNGSCNASIGHQLFVDALHERCDGQESFNRACRPQAIKRSCLREANARTRNSHKACTVKADKRVTTKRRGLFGMVTTVRTYQDVSYMIPEKHADIMDQHAEMYNRCQ